MPGQRHQSADVIGVFMADENGVQGFALFIDGDEARQNIAFAEACVHQDARPLGPNESSVARAAAGEHTDFDDDAPPKFYCSQNMVTAYAIPYFATGNRELRILSPHF
jgi:hypothetical protein